MPAPIHGAHTRCMHYRNVGIGKKGYQHCQKKSRVPLDHAMRKTDQTDARQEKMRYRLRRKIAERQTEPPAFQAEAGLLAVTILFGRRG